MKTFSILDPINHITLKVKPTFFDDGSFSIILELFTLDDKNKIMSGVPVDFFLDESDVDFISYLYSHKRIPENGYNLIRGKNGKARGFNITHKPSLSTAGHVSIKIANGTGTIMPNGFTSLKTVEKSLIINITFEQSIKLLKYLERAVLIFLLKNEIEFK